MVFDADSEKENSLLSSLKSKVIWGYALIILLAIISMFFVFNNLQNLDSTRISQTLVAEKTNGLNDISFYIYESECIINEGLIMPEVFNLYKEKSDFIINQIESLKTLFTDVNQQAQLDSLSFLLKEKEKNVGVISLLARQTSIDDIYKKNLYQSILDFDTVKYNRVVEHKTTVKHDTVTIKRQDTQKQSFFRRLTRIFSPKTYVDTTVNITTSEYVVKDSVITSYNVADSINAILADIKAKVRKEKKNIDKDLNNKLLEIELNNQDINHQINSIMHNLRNEDISNYIQSDNDNISALSTVFKYMRYISIFTILFGALFIIMLLRDIKKSRKYRLNLEKANKETIDLMNNRENLMMGITHDIKAPLGSVIGYIELLNDNTLNAKQSYYLNNMKQSAQHIQKLIVDVLDFNRLKSGVITFSPISFSVKSLFEEIVNIFMPQVEEKKLELLYEFHSDIQTNMLKSDPLRIKQIVTNLISNALKFTKSGSITLSVSVSLLDEELKKAVLLIKVIDTGIGISQENMPLIFKEYTRANNNEIEKTDGVGLGLSIVSKIVEKLDGEISVESKLNEGSIFTVSLPVNFTLVENESEGAKPKVDFANILFLDDDDLQLTIMSEFLRNMPVKLTTCSSSLKALDLIKNEKFDIIFSDIQMPDLNGFEFVKKVRGLDINNAKDMIIVALSARADIALSVFCEHGFSDFLPKPFTNAQISAMITKYVEFCGDSKPIDSNKVIEKVDEKKGMYSKLLEFAGGDEEAEREIINLFKQETSTHLTMLLKAQKEKDLTTINKVSHKMLAVFKMLDNKNIIEWLLSLEVCVDFSLIDKKLFKKNINYIKQTYDVK